MTATESSTGRRRRRWTALVLVVFGGTIAWAGRFTAGYLLVPAACEVGDWVMHLVTLIFALAALAALIASVRWARRADDASIRFSLWFGTALNAFFLGAILLEGSGVLFVDSCLKGAIP